MNRLIPLEEVEKRLLGKFDYKTQSTIENEIYSIPTIDPFATIDEMIEEFHTGYPTEYTDPVKTLQELKSLLLLTQK